MDLAGLISKVNGIVWGPPVMILLVGTGLYLSVRLRLIQFRGFGRAWRALRTEKGDEQDQGEITPFQALAASLAATIGTGNIVGVATAIAAGGPGA